MDEKRVFVTGGTGFIGSHLVRALVKKGFQVTVLARSSSSTRFLPRTNVTVIHGDVCSPDKLAEGMKNCSTVFHNAALATDWGAKRDFYNINLGGTMNVLKAARDLGVKSVILTSTIGVMGEEDCTAPKAETAPYKPRIPYFLDGMVESAMNHYRCSKAKAEQWAIDFCSKENINLTVIRPAWVYGPREFHSGPYLFCKAVLEGNKLLPGCRDNLFHVIYVEDLVEAMVAAAEKELQGINVYTIGTANGATIGDGSVPTMDEFWNRFCAELDAPMPRYLPKWLVYPVGLVLELLYMVLRIRSAPLLTRARVYMCYASNVYDVGKAERELGFKARTPLEKGVAKTVRWWKLNGFL